MPLFQILENRKYFLDFRWRVTNFNETSPKFFILGCNIVWKLLVINTNGEHFEVKLKIDRFSKDVIKVITPLFFFEIQNQYGERVYRKTVSSSLTKPQESFGCTVKKLTVCRASSNNGFKAPHTEFDIWGHVMIQPDSLENSESAYDENVTRLQQDFSDFFKDQQMADVSFIIGDETVPAHQFVLCSRSAVFKKMFETGMKEAQTNKVTIVDVEKHIFETFLVFLYTGILEDKTFDTVLSLYSLADQYCVDSLQNTCRVILINTLSVMTVVFVLKVSNQHSDDPLKKVASDFICDQFAEVEQSAEWNVLLQTDPSVASYVLKNLSVKLSKK